MGPLLSWAATTAGLLVFVRGIAVGNRAWAFLGAGIVLTTASSELPVPSGLEMGLGVFGLILMLAGAAGFTTAFRRPTSQT
jgi:hypothetical protein